MLAIQYHRYGGPEVVQTVDRPIPEPGPNDVLVKVRAASINAADYRLMRADPAVVRLENGFLRPKNTTLGSDFSGTVEAIGSEVSNVRVGDAVFGDSFPAGRGAFAEFVCVGSDCVASKPDNVTFAEAAASPMCGLVALQALRDLGRVEPGDDVLVQGAGGGVGGFMVQMASVLGARVVAVCSPRSAELARAAGAYRIVDHTTEDFATESARYDVIVGVNGYRRLATYRRCLKPGGRYVMVGGTTAQIFGALLFGWAAFAGSGKTCSVLTIDDSKRSADLGTIREMLADGRLRPTIDRRFSLASTDDALRYVEQGHVSGKVIVAPGHGKPTAP